jgi:hypothetical protein
MALGTPAPCRTGTTWRLATVNMVSGGRTANLRTHSAQGAVTVLYVKQPAIDPVSAAVALLLTALAAAGVCRCVDLVDVEDPRMDVCLYCLPPHRLRQNDVR